MACEARIRASPCQCGFDLYSTSYSLCYIHAVTAQVALMLSSMAFHADRPIQRSQSPQNSPQVVLTHAHVADALSCSPDHGSTLILSKLNLSEFDVTVIRSLQAFDEDVQDDRPPIERYDKSVDLVRWPADLP